MQVLVRKTSYILFSLLAISAIALESCKDDEINCDAVESQLEQVWRDLQAAAFEGNCSEVNSLFNRSFSLLRKGKNCQYVEDLVVDVGFSDVKSYIDYLEEERHRVLDAIGC